MTIEQTYTDYEKKLSEKEMNDWTCWKKKLNYQNRHEKYILKTKQPFSYRKHNVIHFRVNVQWSQTAFHSEHQNLGSAENNTCVAKKTGWWRTTIFFEKDGI